VLPLSVSGCAKYIQLKYRKIAYIPARADMDKQAERLKNILRQLHPEYMEYTKGDQ
jgi:hypothetical protein